MKTPFSEKNKQFTDQAHLAAQLHIYPGLFGVDRSRLSFETTDVADGGEKAVLDGQMAVDRRVLVNAGVLKFPLVLTVQERFRRAGPPKYFERYQDITITEYNGNSGLPSELYKICSGLFVYGYFSETNDRFADAIVVSTPTLLTAICRDKLDYTRRSNAKNQTFLGMKFCALESVGAVLWRLPRQS